MAPALLPLNPSFGSPAPACAFQRPRCQKRPCYPSASAPVLLCAARSPLRPRPPRCSLQRRQGCGAWNIPRAISARQWGSAFRLGPGEEKRTRTPLPSPFPPAHWAGSRKGSPAPCGHGLLPESRGPRPRRSLRRTAAVHANQGSPTAPAAVRPPAPSARPRAHALQNAFTALFRPGSRRSAVPSSAMHAKPGGPSGKAGETAPRGVPAALIPPEPATRDRAPVRPVPARPRCSLRRKARPHAFRAVHSVPAATRQHLLMPHLHPQAVPGQSASGRRHRRFPASDFDRRPPADLTCRALRCSLRRPVPQGSQSDAPAFPPSANGLFSPVPHGVGGIMARLRLKAPLAVRDRPADALHERPAFASPQRLRASLPFCLRHPPEAHDRLFRISPSPFFLR